MAFLLFVILIIVLFSAFVPKLLPGLTTKLTNLFIKPSVNELQLREEMRILKTELSSVDMVNEFPRYARIERKINKVKAEIQSLAKGRSEIFLKTKLVITVASYIIQACLFIFLIYNYRQEPVIVVPSSWFAPLDRLLSFPTSVAGGISTPVWIMVCRTVVTKAVKLF